MISVISCSIDPWKTAYIRAHYAKLLADHKHEIIVIHDAKSLCEGYNRGFAQSSGDIIIFSHDDIEILSDDFAPRLLAHMAKFDVLGVVGTTKLCGATWGDAGQPYIHGFVLHPAWGSFQFELFGPPSSRVQAIDGLFMVARRNVVQAIAFDEKIFDGFHLYDLDFSYRAFLAGFKIAVPWDILIYHSSKGSYDPVWKRYAEKFFAKHGNNFPKNERLQTSHYSVKIDDCDQAKILHYAIANSSSGARELDDWSGGSAPEPLSPRWQLALLELPRCAPQTAWLGHLPFLQLLFHLMRPKHYVELGVDLGGSLLAACEASKRENLGTYCLGIGAWQGPSHRIKCDVSRAFEGLSHVMEKNYGDAALRQARFDEAASLCEDGSIDVLFMNEPRSYGALKQDFESWLPKLSKRAVLLIHGTRMFIEEVGNWRLFVELQQGRWNFEFSDWFGLGVVLIGSEPDEGVRALMEYVARSSGNAMALRQACETAAKTMPDRLGAEFEAGRWQPLSGMDKLVLRW